MGYVVKKITNWRLWSLFYKMVNYDLQRNANKPNMVQAFDGKSLDSSVRLSGGVLQNQKNGTY